MACSLDEIVFLAKRLLGTAGSRYMDILSIWLGCRYYYLYTLFRYKGIIYL